MNQAFNRVIIIKLRCTNGLPSHRQRLRARGMLTQQKIAQQLGVHSNAIHAWRRAGLLHAHMANDKNDYLYARTPRDPRLRPKLGLRLADRQSVSSTIGGAM